MWARAQLGPGVAAGSGAATGMGTGADWGRGLGKTRSDLSRLPCTSVPEEWWEEAQAHLEMSVGFSPGTRAVFLLFLPALPYLLPGGKGQ